MNNKDLLGWEDLVNHDKKNNEKHHVSCCNEHLSLAMRASLSRFAANQLPTTNENRCAKGHRELEQLGGSHANLSDIFREGLNLPAVVIVSQKMVTNYRTYIPANVITRYSQMEQTI